MQVIELEYFIGERPAAMTFSPDGSLLAVTLAGRVFLADPVTGAVRQLKTGRATSSSASCGVAFTPDGSKLTVPHTDRKVIEVHDVETGEVAHTFALGHYADVCEPSPDGRRMYIALRENDALKGIVRWDPLTGKQVELVSQQPFLVGNMAVSGNEKWMATARDGVIRLWDTRKKKPLAQPSRELRINNANIFSLTLSSDGAFVAAHCMHYGAPGAVYVADVKTGEIWRAGEDPGNKARGVTFHPSRPILAMRGRAGEVAFYDAAARVELQRYSWPLDDVSARVERQQSAWPRNEVSAVCFSPDGLRCAAVGREGVIVWDMDF